MLQGPVIYSSLDHRRFLPLESSSLSSSSSSSSLSYISTASPSSASHSSYDDSIHSSPPSSFDSPTSAKFLTLSDRLPSSLSAASSSLSYYSPASAVSSATSVDIASPYSSLESGNSLSEYDTPRRTNAAAEAALKHASNLQRQASSAQALPKEQLQNPRRTRRLLDTQDANPVGPQLIAAPPPLVRQADRKVNFVDNLVDTAAQIVEAIWPSSMQKPCEPSLGRVLPLRTFIQETLRRSRTSYSTLQVALYYLFVIRAFIPIDEAALHLSESCPDARALQCGRRMFLAALILASKYLQDRNYSARAWSKISGLNITEINTNELAFLTTVNWKLHISDHIFDRWTKIVLKCTPTTSILPAKASVHCNFASNRWIHIFSQLNGSLDLLILEDMLAEESPAVRCTESKLSSLQTINPEDSAASVPNFATASVSGKINSMAFALAAPTVGRGMCNENMPTRSSDERLPARCSRKSSLSVCETIDSCQMDVSAINSSMPTCSSALRNLTRSSDKLTIVVDPRQQLSSLSRSTAPVQVTPVREQILGNVRMGSGHTIPTPSAVSMPPVSGKNRKRGNETPVASRHQKKQRDRHGEPDSQKVSEPVVPSGLTPQMRQMNTNFSISGKKGNGIRMNINPGLSLSNMAHGQMMRPGTGQRSMGHVVYG
ncbi:hypothetical protein AOL_s00004g641 [Orbilia oligospora ATCC 24927]|uniref:G1/S-specific cyclin pas1 n=1 Tax=Arthrobotrys oligospora (strain ATCC 24927 / CBS 115.81 / DSM 1491) TaxID=756982 RepID=G1WZD0_ARTOA|nr:hypothetical protein AOL_s00004g641 [Orbilia oligospora ATCC 24927]EGX53982.1 hypothetical protein AOL_s00004g641 [Orbilia oligospora ATCC 24927]